MSVPLIWAVVAATIALILVKPRNVPEAVWACSGAALLLLLGLVGPHDAAVAIGRGLDVYLFLAGMMLLAALARREGLFDWLAVIAVRQARGSPSRLFALVYGVGTAVTIFLSNDATAVVLTPAVLAAVKRVRGNPRPYLFICAFIANAASFALPISNPANIVVYASTMPPLLTWLHWFGLPSLVSIAVTFVMLRFASRTDLTGSFDREAEPVRLSATGRCAALGIAGAATVLLAASALDLRLGLPTFLAAVVAMLLVAFFDRAAPIATVRDVSWSVLPLVAALFVMVAATDHAGARSWSYAALQKAASLGPLAGSLSTGFGVALLSNIANNLPVGLLSGAAVQIEPVSAEIRRALLIGIDLGPNLSVTGSLATILWLEALRRDNAEVGFWPFLRVGLVVMPPALISTILASLLAGR